MDFQEQIVLAQFEREDRYEEIAKLYKNKKVVLFCDRGFMDGRAYINPRQFEAMLENLGIDITERDKRYHGVIHLVTAAIGARKYYTTRNNKARKEYPEEAAKLDIKTRESWIGHPHLRVIDNSTDFKGKMKRALAAVCRVVGIPAPLEIERKFLIQPPDMSKILSLKDMRVVEISIEQIYLQKIGKKDRRIRKRGQDGHFVYYLTKKKNVRPGVRIETERQIDPMAYFLLAEKEADRKRSVIQKNRYCFLWKNQYFELDIFTSPKRLAGLSLLEIELTEENDKVEIPPFIKVIRDVTEDPEFTNHSLAKKK